VLANAIYINLQTSTARRNWMESQLPRFHFQVERLEAATLDDVAREERCPEILVNNTINPNPYPNVLGKWSVVACECSHYLAAKNVAAHAAEMKERNELWVIFEDDIHLEDEMHAMWTAAWPYVPDDWDVLRLSWFGGSSCPFQINAAWDLAVFSDPPPDGPCDYCGLQAYVLNPNTVHRVIDRYERSKLYHADYLMSAATPPGENETEVPPLRAFAMRQMVGHQDDVQFGSDIASFGRRDDTAADAPSWARNSAQ